jgi:flagellar basal body rod protein FlgG
MNVGLFRAAVAMASSQKELETMASNLANVGTTGYKRGSSAAQEFELQRARGPVRGLALETAVDFSQGELVRTERPLDLALFGEGFFAVESPAGEVYTRDGSFHLTETGVLVTEEGNPVAWETQYGQIDPTGLPIVVDGNGGVKQGTQDMGRLRVVAFADQRALSLDRFGNWIAPANLREVAHDAQVHQGALEQSNASAVDELVAMIGLQRHFEAVAGVMSSIEESYRRLTRPV